MIVPGERSSHGPATEAAPAELGLALLDFLRRVSDDARVEYAVAPRRITTGFETSIYAFDLQGGVQFARPYILRMFRNDGPDHARFETIVHNAVAAQGFPAPRIIHSSDSADDLGAPFVVMERVPGTTVLELLRNPMAGRAVARLLAETQARLHGLDPGPLRRALEDAGLPHVAQVESWSDQIELRISRAALDGLRPGASWLRDNRPPEGSQVICHGDFHPANVLVHDGNITGVIDWSLAKIAPPAFDIGNSRVIMTLGHRGVAGPLDGIVGVMTRRMVKRYSDSYRMLRPVDEGAVTYYEALRCLQSLVWAGEHRAAAARGVDLGPNPWTGKRESTRLIAHFRKITGLALSLPPAI
jgi:aminoglycoside phosphotransferase (APT) family kinase protein